MITLRTVDLLISGRKEPGYPQHHFNIAFTSIRDLLKKVDAKAEELDYQKIDVIIDDTTVKTNPSKLHTIQAHFTKGEYNYLEKEFITIQSGIFNGPNA